MEEENCHFVNKHLWSSVKAPCSPQVGSVPGGGESPGTQSILHRGDLQAEGLGRCWCCGRSAQGGPDSDLMCCPEEGKKDIPYPQEICPLTHPDQQPRDPLPWLDGQYKELKGHSSVTPLGVHKSVNCLRFPLPEREHVKSNRNALFCVVQIQKPQKA